LAQLAPPFTPGAPGYLPGIPPSTFPPHGTRAVPPPPISGGILSEHWAPATFPR